MTTTSDQRRQTQIRSGAKMSNVDKVAGTDNCDNVNSEPLHMDPKQVLLQPEYGTRKV